MPCKRCGKRARSLLKWLGFRYVADGDEYVLRNPLVSLRIPRITVHQQHLRASILALCARLLYPPR